MGRQNLGYEHWVPAAKLNPDFRKDLTYVDIRTCAQLLQILKENSDKKYMAWDLETSSLNAEEGFIVGASFAFDCKVGYYIPVRHATDTSLGYKALAILYKFMTGMKMTFGYNIRFDLRFYEFESERAKASIPNGTDPEIKDKLLSQYNWDMQKVHIFDVQDSVWLADTNKKMPSLKWAEEHFLGWPVTKFEEALGGEQNFHYVDVLTATEYAGQDAIGTFALAGLTMKYYVESKQSGKIDMEMLYPLMRWENEPQQLDLNELRELRQVSWERLKELEHEIYRIAGTTFKINSNRDCTEVFERLGIDTGSRIKSGDMQIKLPILENMIKMGNDHPMLKAIVEYKKLFKQINSYIDPILKIAESDKGFARFAYQTTNVPCLTENNLVAVHGKGLISIKEVKKGDLIHTQYGYKEVLWNDAHFSEEIVRVTLKDGQVIEGTPGHPVLVNKTGSRKRVDLEWCPLASLTEYDDVVTNHHEVETGFVAVGLPDPDMRKARNKYSIPMMSSPDLCRLLGFIDGDGSCMDDRVDLDYSAFEPEMQKYTELFTKLFNVEKYTIEVRDDNTVRHSFFMSGLSRWLKKIGCKSDRVPDCVMRGGPVAWANYIAGYWDADGSLLSVAQTTIKAYKYCPRVCSIENKRMADMQVMLSMLSVETHLYQKGKSDKKPRTEIRVKGAYGRNWFRDQIAVGLWNDKKRIRAFENCERGSYDTAQSKVLSVERLPGAIVYDIEVEDVHEYVANGIVTHNTGRLSAGKDAKNTFFSPVNVQSVPKPKTTNWYVREATEEEIAKGDHVMGYHFSLTEWAPHQIEGFKPEGNPRNAFICHRPDAYWVSMDMSGEELRIVANLFSEPTWLNAFLTGGDIHKQTAERVFGKENYSKTRRKQAKTVNFGIIYGMTYQSFHEKHPEMPLEECEQFFKDYKKALPYLFAGQDKVVRRAKKEGCVHTVFGRPRRVRYYLNNADRKKRGFGVRTVNNTIVQGVGGDALRLIFVRIWNALLKDGNPYDVRWRNTIHDEINWSIPEEHIRTVLPILVKCMTIRVPGWKVPLECGLEVGRRWGQTFAFKYDIENGIYTPDWEDTPTEDKTQKVEADEEPEEDFSNIYFDEESPDSEEW